MKCEISVSMWRGGEEFYWRLESKYFRIAGITPSKTRKTARRQARRVAAKLGLEEVKS